MTQVLQESAACGWEVEALFDTCFAPGRTALSSYRLREGVAPVADLCLTWRDEAGTLAGAIRTWPVRIGVHEALLIGPVAVHPIQQGSGLGGLLMREVIARGKALGWKRIILVGDPAYYKRFGFEKLQAVVMPPPTNPDRVLGLDLVSGAWSSVTGDVEKAL